MDQNPTSLDYLRIRNQFRAAGWGVPGTFFLAIFAVLVLWNHVESVFLFTWFSVIAVYGLIRTLVIRKYYRFLEKYQKVNLSNYDNLFFISVAVLALLWGSLIFFPSKLYIAEYQNHIGIIFGCAAVAAMATYSFSMRSSITFSFTLLAAFLVKVVLIEKIGFHFMGIGFLVVAIIAVGLCLYLHNLQMSSLRNICDTQNMAHERDVARKQYKKLSENLKVRLATERLIAHSLQDTLDFQSSIIENSLSGIYVIDRQGVFLQANEVGASILGHTREELFGQNSQMILYGYEGRQLTDKFREIIRTRTAVKGLHSKIRRKDGVLIDILFNAAPILKGEEVIGTVCSVEDVTHKNRIEAVKKIRMETLERLAKGHDLLKILQRILEGFGEIMPGVSSCVFLYDEFSDKLVFKAGAGIPEFYSNFTMKLESTESNFPCVKSIRTGKRITINDIGQKKELDPVMSRFASMGFLSCLSQPIIGEHKNSLGVFEVFCRQRKISKYLDVQFLEEFLQLFRLAIERKSIETELVARNRSLLTLYKISSAVFEEIELNRLFDKILKALSEVQEVGEIERVKIFMNHHGRLNLYYDSKEKPDPGERVCSSIARGECLCGITFDTGEVIVSGSSVNDPRHLPFEQNLGDHSHIVIPLIGREKISGVLCLYTGPGVAKITENDKYFFLSTGRQVGLALENASLYEELKRMSLNDPLTGLANRHRMKIMVQKLLPMAKRKNEPVCVAFLDLDFFKAYNDTKGHAEGDRLLEQVGLILRQSIREEDLAVRYGGEEFLLILSNTSLEAAHLVLERVRQQVLKKTNVSISSGLAQYDFKTTFEDLLEHADTALYEAKKSGRNRVVVWKENKDNQV